MLSLLSVGFFNRGETRADLKCEEKEPSVSGKLIIDVISVTKEVVSMSLVVSITSDEVACC